MRAPPRGRRPTTAHGEPGAVLRAAAVVGLLVVEARRRVDDGGVGGPRLLEHEHGGGGAVVRRQQLDLDLEDARGVGDGISRKWSAIPPCGAPPLTAVSMSSC